jgi:hypothetical protein
LRACDANAILPSEAEWWKSDPIVGQPADDPSDLKGVLKSILGSRSDHWCNLLVSKRLRRFG